MVSRVHPLTGEPYRNGKKRNGVHPPNRNAFVMPVTENRRQANLTYDSARKGTDLDGHWAHADALDADSANSPAVRETLRNNSRYEDGSNGYYCGILRSYCDVLVGVGPSLRMLTGNRDFNQLVERSFNAWATAIQLNRKLWCMAHARVQDGEAFAILQTNPGINNDVQLDVRLIEAEQCHTPTIAPMTAGYIDGIKFDEYDNIEWYDVLPYHPGSNQWNAFTMEAISVPPRQMLHWFRLERPGAHRGVPDLKSTFNVGASSRRFREATVAASETAADLAAISSTQSAATTEEPDEIAPFTGVPLQKRTWLFNPMGWDVSQMKAEHPNAQYSEFTRQQISEQARPISMPYNAAAMDSSTYSFASGKLDTLMHRAGLDVVREVELDPLVMDRIFSEWFREWTVVASRRDIPPEHQWDWPAHPVIDEVAHENATKTALSTGSTTLRQVYADKGQDYEDQLVIMAEDWFGEATEENIAKARTINMLRNIPQHAIATVRPVIIENLGEQTDEDFSEQPNEDTENVQDAG